MKTRATFTITHDGDEVATEYDFTGVLVHIMKFCEDEENTDTVLEIHKLIEEPELPPEVKVSKAKKQLDELLKKLTLFLGEEHVEKLMKKYNV